MMKEVMLAQASSLSPPTTPPQNKTINFGTSVNGKSAKSESEGEKELDKKD